MIKMKQLILKVSEEFGLDSNIVFGIIMTESNMNPCAIRYETNYKWLYKPNSIRPRTCSFSTEIMMQSCSWGLMQVMGATLRELGFKGWLTSILLSKEQQLIYGCRYFKSKMNKYNNLNDAIVSYNSGHPMKKDGTYINQYYLEKVLKYANSFDGDI